MGMVHTDPSGWYIGSRNIITAKDSNSVWNPCQHNKSLRDAGDAAAQAQPTPRAALAPRAVTARQGDARHSGCGTGVWTKRRRVRLRTSLPGGSAHRGATEAVSTAPRRPRGAKPSAHSTAEGTRTCPGRFPRAALTMAAPVRLPQLTGPRRPDCPAQLTDQALRWRETKTRELANPRGPAPAPEMRA